MNATKDKGDIARNLYDEVRMIRGALRGLGAMLEKQERDATYTADELFGIGQLLRYFAEILEGAEYFVEDQIPL